MKGKVSRFALPESVQAQLDAHAAELMSKDKEPLVYQVLIPASGDPADAFVVSNEWPVLQESATGNISFQDKIGVFKKLIPELRVPAQDTGLHRRKVIVADIPGENEPCDLELLRTWAGAFKRTLEHRKSTLLSLRNSTGTDPATQTIQYTGYQNFLDALGIAAIRVRDDIKQSSTGWLHSHIPAATQQSTLVPELITELTVLRGMRFMKEKLSICQDLNTSIRAASTLCNAARYGGRLKEVNQEHGELRATIARFADAESGRRSRANDLFKILEPSAHCRARLESLSLDELKDLLTDLTRKGKQPSLNELETKMRSFEELPDKPARGGRTTADHSASSKILSTQEIEERRQRERLEDFAFAKLYLKQSLDATSTSKRAPDQRKPTGRSESDAQTGISVSLTNRQTGSYAGKTRSFDSEEKKEPTLRQLAEMQRKWEKRHGQIWRRQREREATLQVGRGSHLAFRTLHGLSLYPKDPSLVDSSLSEPQWSSVQINGGGPPMDTIFKEQQEELERRMAALTAMRALRRKRTQTSSNSRTKSSKGRPTKRPSSGKTQKSRNKAGKGNRGGPSSRPQQSKESESAAPLRSDHEAEQTDLAVAAMLLDENGQVTIFGTYAWCLPSFEDDHGDISYNSLENDKRLNSWRQDDPISSRPRRQSVSFPVDALDGQDLVTIEQLLW